MVGTKPTRRTGDQTYQLLLHPFWLKQVVPLCLVAGSAWAEDPPVAVGPQDIGTLDNHPEYSMIFGMSEDGNTVVGLSGERGAVWSGDNWSTKTELIPMNTDDAATSTAHAVSDDGTVVVGYSDTRRYGTATVWYGDNWSIKKDLYPDTSTNPANQSTMSSIAYAVSGDGSVIGGSRTIPSTPQGRMVAGNTPQDAIIWSGNNWSTATILPALDATRNSNVYGLSVDGTVAVGKSTNGQQQRRAVVWSGDRWATLKDLGTLMSDDTGKAEAITVSDDGSVIGGSAEAATGQSHAVIWSGSDWNTKTDLGSLWTDIPDGYSRVTALSGDGTIVVGSIQAPPADPGADAEMDPDARPLALLWYGDNWSGVIQLPDLTSSTQRSTARTSVTSAQAISRDGTVIGGFSTADNGALHAVIWKLTWPDDGTSVDNVDDTARPPGDNTTTDDPVAPDTPSTNTPSPTQPGQKPVPRPPVVKPVDVTMTGVSLSRLASDTFNTLEVQRQALLRLEQGCLAYGGEFCWKVRHGFSRGITGDGHRNNQTGFSLGYGLSDYVSVGVTLDHAWSQSLPDSYRHHSSNIGVGTFVEWHQTTGEDAVTGKTGEVYFRPSLFWNQNKADVRRPAYAYTEAGRGKTTIRGVGASLEAGMRYWRPDGINTSWYAGTRYTKVSRPGYAEREEAGRVDFPVTYDDVRYTRTVVYAGASLSVPVTEKLSWVSGAEVSQKVGGHDPVFRAGAKYPGGIAQEGEMRNTEGTASSGLEYRPDTRRDIRMSVMPGVTRAATGETDWGGVLSLEGKF